MLDRIIARYPNIFYQENYSSSWKGILNYRSWRYEFKELHPILIGVKEWIENFFTSGFFSYIFCIDVFGEWIISKTYMRFEFLRKIRPDYINTLKFYRKIFFLPYFINKLWHDIFWGD